MQSKDKFVGAAGRHQHKMAYQRAAFQIDDTAFARIWHAQGLGSVRSVDWAGTGVNNPAFVINNSYVLRFDGLINRGLSRFHGEHIAYNHVRKLGIPCPQIIAIDDSQTLVPYDYMIMTRVEGRPLLDSWPDLTSAQQQAVASEAGHVLALMHTISLPQFGRLYGTEQVFGTWYAYITDKFERDAQEAVTGGLLTSAVSDRMRTVLQNYRPVFDSVQQPRLVHWDYHFGNLLQQDGKITAVLDFEWALGGDPAHDFNRRSEWEEQCPDSSAWIYSGYTRLSPLTADHETRVSLYEMLWFLDCVIDAPHVTEADVMRSKLVNRLTWLEENH